jgi:hypothetical protein
MFALYIPKRGTRSRKSKKILLNRTTTAKIKRIKRQIMISKALPRKLMIEQHEPHKNRGELRCPGRVINSCSC